MDDPDEVLDLVDDHDHVIGTIVREDVRKLETGTMQGMVRAVDGFIINSEGALWLPRRVLTKKIAPDGLDVGVGEHVRSGETYLEALVRGFEEEAGMQVSPAQLEYVGKLDLRAVDIPVFEAVYVLRSNETPRYNAADFSGYEWLKPQEVLERIVAGEIVKRNLQSAVKLIMSKGKA